MSRILFGLLLLMITVMQGQAQNLKGKVLEKGTDEGIIGANVVIKGTSTGTTTGFTGEFKLKVADLPAVIQISFIGYGTKEVTVTSLADEIEVYLEEDREILGQVDIIEKRLSEKQRESALTVEALDNLAIKETPAVSFYEALGNLKGVDLTSASIGFKVINTRGFNSTSPVRSLQIINGVDNQAPGLNFSLGNFLGASELDVSNVDIIAGASTAFYGPNAFNGVISMTTKNPFQYQGLSASVKVGERALTETAVRYAEAFNIGGKEYDNFAFKLNVYYLTANDWEAENYDPVDGSPVGRDNPGRYDAINIYGDENLSGNNNFDNLASVTDFPSNAGLGIYYRQGFREVDLVDYDTRNFKGNMGLYYMLDEETELSYNFYYGTGTTVYQGENRFSLKDIQFYQNVVELRKPDKFFVRAYATNEDAGNSYDAVLTAFKMNQAIGDDNFWLNSYRSFWRNTPYRFGEQTLDATGRFTDFPDLTAQEWFDGPYKDSLAAYSGLITTWHDSILGIMNEFSFPRPEPGTAAYDSLFNSVASKTFTEGGSKFFDRSALYHIMGEYQLNPGDYTVKLGGNYRLYLPNSRGNIFDELVFNQFTDSTGATTTDTSFREIRNEEFGFYVGVQRTFLNDRLKADFTARMDKNQNFDYLFSPAISLIYVADRNNTLRLSFSSAIRNPTLQDQYLRYNVGRAILLGNINGFDSLVTLESFDDYRTDLNRDLLEYVNVAPIKPERAQTVEVGYRGSLFKRLYVDLGYYHSWYQDFIGFQLGLDLTFRNSTDNLFQSLQAFRVSANAKDEVTTQGFNGGLNYYLTDELTLNGNYSWNRLDLKGSEDPIIPAYNTPENKFNIGLTGRGYKLWKQKDHKLGFSVNYKWVQGFLFEGSPQFTGFIDDYGMTDAQVSYQVPKLYSTFKLGASNVLDNRVFQVYGGPTIGRMIYFSILFEKF